jgi:quinol monooxygenase YgiN
VRLPTTYTYDAAYSDSFSLAGRTVGSVGSTKGVRVMPEVLITRMVVHPDAIEHSLVVFRDMQADVHANESGTLSYQYYQDVNEPTIFWVHEVFADSAAKNIHLGRHHQRRPDFDAILAEAPVFHEVAEI